MQHIRLDLHAFDELCKSIRLGEGIILCGAELDGPVKQIVIPAEVSGKLILRESEASARLPAPTLTEKTT